MIKGGHKLVLRSFRFKIMDKDHRLDTQDGIKQNIFGIYAH
jgi:hypothetical protein